MEVNTRDFGLKLVVPGFVISVAGLLIEAPVFYGQEINIPILLRLVSFIAGIVLTFIAIGMMFPLPKLGAGFLWTASLGILIIGTNYISPENESRALVYVLSLCGAIPITIIAFRAVFRSESSSTSNWRYKKSVHKWDIPNADGRVSTVQRYIDAVCLSNNVTIWEELIFGSDMDITDNDYKTTNGKVIFVDDQPEGKVVTTKLNRTYNLNDRIEFQSSRTLTNAFAQNKNWVSVNFFKESLLGPLEMEVYLPPQMQIQAAYLEVKHPGKKTRTLNLHPQAEANSTRLKLIHKANNPVAGEIYTIKWILR